ncbi:MAG: hypothetical protein RBT37_01300 [Dissulfurispiraceae bacterium]|jgi:hypothetical protein|nr:hypothetical protein [Dissulfurispiraceae bacterium]
MKKFIITFAAGFMLLCFGSVTYAQPNEETCKKQVESTIAAIDAKEKATGAKAGVNGMSKEDIIEMLKAKSYCETMAEINKKTLK